MAKDKVISIRFVDGALNGIRIFTLKPATLLGVIVPRDLLSRAKSIDLPTRGPYYLLECKGPVIQKVYVGQTTQGIQRVIEHNRNKDWWNVAVLFLSNNADLVSSDVLYDLEKIAIDKAKAALGRIVTNKVGPRHVVLPNDKPTVDSLYEEVDFIMRVIGYPIGVSSAVILDQPAIRKKGVPKPVEPQPNRDATSVRMTRRDITACGVYSGGTEGTLTVLKGSFVDMGAIIDPRDKMTLNTRHQLLSEGKLDIQAGGDLAILMEDVTFDSPSTAAQFVYGGSINGREHWKCSDGRSIKEVWGTRKNN